MASTEEALQSWKALLSDRRVLHGNALDSHPQYAHIRDFVTAVVFPESTQDVVEIVRIAVRHTISLHPISTGYNFGYGGVRPSAPSCCIVDLSRMREITAIDRDLGLITVEPGVTTGQVREYLEAHNVPFLSPAIGIGPRASMIGSALEKGRSGTPYIDRFASLIALEAVLPDGSLYRSPSAQGNGIPFFKWGVGPYLDGLFVQSNMGIVTSATFALAPKAESVIIFSATAREDTLASLIDTLRTSAHALGDAMPIFSIQSAERVLSRGTYRSLDDDEQVSVAARIGEWTVFGSVRGTSAIARSAARRLRRDMRRNGHTVALYSARTLRLLERSATLLARMGVLWYTRAILPKLRAFYRSADEGWIPFPGIDLKRGNRIVPVVLPLKGEVVAAYAREARAACAANDQDYVATILNFSPQCALFTLYFSFDQNDAEARERVSSCAQALSVAARANGGYVYRASSNAMGEVVGEGSDNFWSLVRKIKTEIDPDNILAPGRYDGNNRT